ncbi:hypothetical protein Patl1_10205 [Pistacia atlantica]|uniref:Uncharacterized protein n=1 Tax=Pistacia atlantica TaxID=434234 RepID=A0ACC1A3G3_9ROSI|nr:hypothetical protein Patl1_10205 [Pistacia atlantica]
MHGEGWKTLQPIKQHKHSQYNQFPSNSLQNKYANQAAIPTIHSSSSNLPLKAFKE